jgi:hypothetical protein
LKKRFDKSGERPALRPPCAFGRSSPAAGIAFGALVDCCGPPGFAKIDFVSFVPFRVRPNE